MEQDQIILREIKPALSGYIRDASALLRKNPVPDEDAVHDVRVLMKKSRAVMKLISTQIDPESYNRDYSSLREVGRILSSWRDTSVQRKILKDLKKNNQVLFASLAENEKINLLLQKQDMLPEPSESMKADLEKIGEMLGKTGYRVRFQTLDRLSPAALLMSLEESFRIVVDRYIICRSNPKPANIHEFRKKAKDLLYQLWFFRPLDTASVKALEKKLDALTQNLGKNNDLTQLINTLEYKYTGDTGNPAMDELILIIRQMQDNYLSKVWPTAMKIFKPGQKIFNVLGFKILMINEQIAE